MYPDTDFLFLSISFHHIFRKHADGLDPLPFSWTHIIAQYRNKKICFIIVKMDPLLIGFRGQTHERGKKAGPLEQPQRVLQILSAWKASGDSYFLTVGPVSSWNS